MSDPSAPGRQKSRRARARARSPKPYSVSTMLFGPARLRIAIPALLVCVPLLFGAGVYSVIEYHTQGAKAIQGEALEQIRAQVPLLMVVGCLFALLVGFGIVYYLVRPLEKLRESIERASRGDFSQRLGLGQARDEIGQMGQSYDQMIEALNDLFSKRNRLIFDNKLQAVLMLALEGGIVSANEGASELLGGGEELVGRNLMDVLEALPGNEPLSRDLRGSLASGRQLSARQHLLVDASGEAKAIIVSTASLRGEGGERAGMAATFQNMAGLRDFYQRINRSDRLAAVGTLAMGLAHEIRNPLASIKGLTQMLAQSGEKGSDAERYGEVIIQEVNRLDHLLTELLEFSQPAELAIETVVLGGMMNSLARAARLRVEGRMGRELEPAEVSIQNDGKFQMPREKVYQALLNIALNAFEAAAENEGKVFLRVQRRRESALIEIENTGSTIPPENLEKIFQPFFTTKDGGTGLGLALTYQILTYVGAQIDVHSEDGSTRFVVELPEALVGSMSTGSFQALAEDPSGVPPGGAPKGEGAEEEDTLKAPNAPEASEDDSQA